MGVTSIRPVTRHLALSIVIILVVHDVSRAVYLTPNTQKQPGNSVLNNACPEFCQCDTVSSRAACTLEYGEATFADVDLQKWSLVNLTMSGSFACLPEQIHGQTTLQHLKLTNSLLSSLSCGLQETFQNIVNLDLSQNFLSYLEDANFLSFPKLKVLNLSYNEIFQMDELTFENQHSLEMLDLSRNHLDVLQEPVFDSLVNLSDLDLSYNQFRHIHDSVFKKLLKLQSLKLNNNKLVIMTFNILKLLPGIQAITISGNNWECTCMLESLLDYVQTSPGVFVNDRLSHCSQPLEEQHRPLVDMYIPKLQCPKPNIHEVTHQLTVVARNNIRLTCDTTSFPHAQIYWLNPQGQAFAHKSVQLDWYYLNVSSVKSRREYSWPLECIDTNTVVYVGKDASLYVENLHGSFAGNYMCLAVNRGGQTNVTVEVKVVSLIRPIYYKCMTYGAAASGGMLVLAVIVGLAKMCRSCCKTCVCCCCRCCCCCKNDEDECKKTEEEEEYISSASSMLDGCDQYNYKSDDDDNGSKSPISWGQTPRLSPRKCPTPTGDSKERWLTANISETLDEVKVQLERRMDKVRSHVQYMKESGSQYIMTIKDTGSQAAIRVKAGMVLGVEQVKFGVQSMKEFCGTGEMGQTISMISVSTDIDTQQQTEVVKIVTYV